MSEEDKPSSQQASQQTSNSDSDKSNDAPNADPVPLNKTLPAPPDKMTDASFTEGYEGIAVFVQAEGDDSGDEGK